ncbi:hypothetical protein NT239_03705 [Chitinibacter sp. SCUT-21]|uniref:hypothetical protein n=1 Tax=Chitinibacter sp. SCUT-21 TaxID=2970891 RepID=UPI0035A68AED
MAYVERDQTGQIVAIYRHANEQAQEELSPNHPDLIKFVQNSNQDFNHSDTALIRVIEDIVDVLIDKNLLRLTDLPVAAQEKLLSRKSLRQRLSNSLDLLIDSDQGLL